MACVLVWEINNWAARTPLVVLINIAGKTWFYRLEYLSRGMNNDSMSDDQSY